MIGALDVVAPDTARFTAVPSARGDFVETRFGRLALVVEQRSPDALPSLPRAIAPANSAAASLVWPRWTGTTRRWHSPGAADPVANGQHRRGRIVDDLQMSSSRDQMGHVMPGVREMTIRSTASSIAVRPISAPGSGSFLHHEARRHVGVRSAGRVREGLSSSCCSA